MHRNSILVACLCCLTFLPDDASGNSPDDETSGTQNNSAQPAGPNRPVESSGDVATAAEDLSVLPLEFEGEPVRTMMQRSLAAQAAAAFEAWRQTYEALKTPEQIIAYQQSHRAEFEKRIGRFPSRAPLGAQTTGMIQCGGFRIEKTLFESQPRHFVSANLYLPDSDEFEPPYPGVLIVCGHAKVGKAYDMYARAGALCAVNGMVALIIDPIGQGERFQWLDTDGQPKIGWGTYTHTIIGISAALLGQNTARFEIWDAMRGIDYLQSRPEVDGERIGVTGNSGGGTQTSYVMALDDRVGAAVPSCYLTSYERLLATIGPQDAEQNIFGQIAWGMLHADYVLMRAPKPTLIAANSQDFFDIDGTWDTFRYAKRIYTRLGMADMVDLQELDAKHGFHQPSREAAVRFLVQHLRGELRRVSEPADLAVPPENELSATPDGQVMRLPGARSVYDLMSDDLALMAANRPELTAETIRKTAGFPAPDGLPKPDVLELGRVDRDSCTITKLVFRFQEGPKSDGATELLLPALLFTPKDTPKDNGATKSDKKRPRAPRPVLYVHGSGKSVDAAPGRSIENLVGDRRVVLAIDVRGVGETLDPDRQLFYHDDFGAAGREYMTAYLLGRSYVGMRATDILIAAKWLRGQMEPSGTKSSDTTTEPVTVDLVAVGHVGVPALHAAASTPEWFAHVRIVKSLDSWASLIQSRVHKDQLVNLVHGVLRSYDLPDLRAALGDRIEVVDPVDSVGDRLGGPTLRSPVVWMLDPVDVPSAVATTEAQMKPYREEIGGSEIGFDMVPISGGSFVMGSPTDEADRTDAEGPRHAVELDPFWIGKFEVTWDEYELWGIGLDQHIRSVTRKKSTRYDLLADAITMPTPAYTDMTFGMGKEDHPAICMTQLAAKIYCKWLSAKTGRFYRLPTEAEWEYACRAGTTTAYGFGDGADALDDYAWYFDNADDEYHAVGQKKPNRWGLYDMHGNVAEWVLDRYSEDGYPQVAGSPAKNPVYEPTAIYPRVVRGGSWVDDPEILRSAARVGSEESWKEQDPQIPQSIWYHTDAEHVGFRVVRPLNNPSPQEATRYDVDEAQKEILSEYAAAEGE